MQLKYSNYAAFSHVHGVAVNNSGIIISFQRLKLKVILQNTGTSEITIHKICICRGDNFVSVFLFHIFPKLSIIYLVFYISGFIYPVSVRSVI